MSSSDFPSVVVAAAFCVTASSLSLRTPLLSQERDTEPEQPRIAEIYFVGADWIPRDHLLSYLGLRPGDPYSPQAETAAVRRLLSWARLASVRPARPRRTPSGDVLLSFDINAHPRILSLEFSGQRSLSASELQEAVRLRPGELLRPDSMERAEEQLLSKYHQEGYLCAAVETEAISSLEAPGGVDILFSIEEGHRVVIRSIQFAGNDSIPDRQLAAVLHHRPRLLFGILSKGFFEPQRLEEDLTRLTDFYRNRGYLDVRVVRGGLQFSHKLRQVVIQILIEEGRRFVLEDIRLEGNNPVLQTALRRRIKSKSGDFYDGQKLAEDRRSLVSFYQGQTFRMPRIRIDHRFHLEEPPPGVPDRVVIAFVIDEREHFFTGRVDVVGNERTRDRVIRSRMTLEPMGPFTENALQESTDSVHLLDYFETVESQSSAAPDRVSPFLAPSASSLLTEPGIVKDVEVTVTEKPTGLFEVGGGASSGEGEIFTIRLTQPNFDLFDLPGDQRGWKHPFSGGGQLFRLEVNPGTKISEFLFHFAEPYFFSTQNSLSLTALNRSYQWIQFDELHNRGEIEFRRYWDRQRRLSTTLTWVLEDVKVDDPDPDVPAEVSAFEGHTFHSYPSLRLSFNDTRSDFYRGPSGFRVGTELDIADSATGSETSFVRSLTKVDHYQPMNGLWNSVLPGEPLPEDIPQLSHILHLGARFGWMDGIDGDSVPFFERFMVGGPRSYGQLTRFRGFSHRGVGPRANGVPVGGEAFWSGTVEYSFPLFIRDFRLLGLFDFGDVQRRFSDFSSERIRTAAGVGLLIRLKLLGHAFPVNLFWVEVLRKEPDDRDRFFTFTLGLTF